MADKAPPPAAAEVPKKEKKEKKGKKDKKDKKGGGGGGGGPAKMDPPADYLAFRNQLFDDLFAKQQEELAAKAANDSKPIKITLPDGKVVEGESWKTSPYDVAMGISQGLAKACVIAKVNEKPWDLVRVFEEDSTLELIKFDSEEGKDTFWHSSAHILGQALELRAGGELCYGPEIETGFYYDTYLGDAPHPRSGKHWGAKTLSQDDFKPLDELIKQIIKQEQPYQRLVIKKPDLLKMFEYNRFKHRLIETREGMDETTVYRCGDLIDLCRGPHIRHTGCVKAMKVVKNSSSYWEGNADNEVLQRVYGISFPDKKQMKEWEAIQKAAAERDHRKIGAEQELFFFHDLSPGSCFFLPRGAFIYNTLIEYLREEYRQRGFQEVITPNMYNSKLWETSGHWQHYQKDMFDFQVDEETFALKPMNCPGHCLLFKHRPRSHKELPLRLADFGVLHRNEKAGALTGLTRVRRFQQDDAHIFCMPSQIESEMAGCLDFLTAVYGTFGFTFECNLSTKPAKALGDDETWEMAEKALARSLDAFGKPWKIKPGDGAFYGPKIDIEIRDALKRPFQCATIQLDFQLPRRFGLEFIPGDEKPQQPVMIHRAILGSVERMMAILIENYAGSWPFWINPRQAIVIPVHPALNKYAKEVCDRLCALGFMVEVNLNDSEQLKRKIRNAELAHFGYIFSVGQKEQESGSVDVRAMGGKQMGQHSLETVIKHFTHLASSRCHPADDFPAPAGADAAAAPKE